MADGLAWGKSIECQKKKKESKKAKLIFKSLTVRPTNRQCCNMRIGRNFKDCCGIQLNENKMLNMAQRQRIPQYLSNKEQSMQRGRFILIVKIKVSGPKHCVLGLNTCALNNFCSSWNTDILHSIYIQNTANYFYSAHIWLINISNSLLWSLVQLSSLKCEYFL